MNTPFDDEPKPPRRPGRFAGLRASFLTGLVVIDEEGRPEGVVHIHHLWRTELF